MRTLFRIELEGSTILALALFSAALHGALRSVGSQRATVGLEGLFDPAVTPREFAPNSLLFYLVQTLCS
jgi:hypothetical protein